MKDKKKASIEKWQMIIQWACAVIWIVVVILDLTAGQDTWITVPQVIAAVCFAASAVMMTIGWYREKHHD